MGSMLKDDRDRITLRVAGGGPAGVLIACTDGTGNVKGCIDHPLVELPAKPNGHLDVGGAVGHGGTLTVIKDLNLKEPYVGSVELVSGEIAEDLTSYFAVSEQIPTACGLGVLINTDQSVLCAGGYIVQLLPGADDAVAGRLEGAVGRLGPVTDVLNRGADAQTLLKQLLEGMGAELLERVPVSYRCYCSRERVERALISLGRKELEEMLREQGGCQLSCQFCDTVYDFSKEDLERLLASL